MRFQRQTIVTANSGFIFSIVSLFSSMIIILLITGAVNSVTKTAVDSEKYISDIQSGLNAKSGICFSNQWLKANSLPSLIGIWPFYKGNISITSSTTDRFGIALPPDIIRLVSTSLVGESSRRMQAKFTLASSPDWPAISIISDGQLANISLRYHFRFDGDVFFEDNLSIDCDGCVGNIENADFYHLSSSSIADNGQGNHLNTTLVDIAPATNFDLSQEDSLIYIAETITHTGENKILGNYKLENESLDLSTFSNQTLFINGKAKFEGASVYGGSTAEPAFLVTSGSLTLKGEHDRPTTFSDNIILISKKKISIKKNTQFGIDRQATPPLERPLLCNEIFSQASININRNSKTIWAQLICPNKKIVLSSEVFGGVYAPGEGLELLGNQAYFEGSLVASKIAHQPDLIEGSMVLFGNNFSHFASDIRYQLKRESIIEY